MDALEIVKKDLASIYIGNLNTVEADLTLPAFGPEGSRFTWKTSDERFIDVNGKVGRPLFGMGSRKVWLTCIAEKDGASEERVFEATVLQKKRADRLERILPVKLKVHPGETPRLTSAAIAYCDDGRKITIPVSWGKPVEKEGKFLYTGTLEDFFQTAEAEVVFDENTPVTCFGAEPEKKRSFWPVNNVRLLPGTEYFRAGERMNEYLLSVDNDSMLYNFREAAGISLHGASPMTGWDAPECKLKGHTTGHYISGLALAYAATGDKRFAEKLDDIIEGLQECKDAFAQGGKTKPGFLSAYDETQFDLLEIYTKYPEIWAPYYTFEKIMSGLYDAYTLANREKALPILVGMGDWAYERLKRLPAEQRSRMWAMYIAGEHGGMIGILAKLGRLTGEKKYLLTAEFFLNDKLYYPMGQNEDTLEDIHANQHIPQIIGAMEMYGAGAGEQYHTLAANFWSIVTGHHAYCLGGVGETEMFHAPDTETRFLTEKAAESCASYNMLRLTGMLGMYDTDPVLWDYYENTLLNHILSSASRQPDGGTTYFMPLCPGGRKEYSTEENTCCHGTGMESRYRYMENIFSYDESTVYVNLFIDSELTLPDGKHLVLKTEFDTGAEPHGRVTVCAPEGLDRALKLRCPEWMKETEGGFFLAGPVAPGTEISVSFKMETVIRPVASDPSYSYITCGPFLMAAESSVTEFLPAKETLSSLIRFNETNLAPYHVYFLS